MVAVLFSMDIIFMLIFKVVVWQVHSVRKVCLGLLNLTVLFYFS